MAYRIEIELIKENKIHHAIGIFNNLVRLLSKFGLGNFRSITMRDEDRWEPIANINLNEKLPDMLQAANEEYRHERFKEAAKHFNMTEATNNLEPQ